VVGVLECCPRDPNFVLPRHVYVGWNNVSTAAAQLSLSAASKVHLGTNEESLWSHGKCRHDGLPPGLDSAMTDSGC
jgi:hypothetical protein